MSLGFGFCSSESPETHAGLTAAGSSWPPSRNRFRCCPTSWPLALGWGWLGTCPGAPTVALRQDSACRHAPWPRTCTFQVSVQRSLHCQSAIEELALQPGWFPLTLFSQSCSPHPQSSCTVRVTRSPPGHRDLAPLQLFLSPSLLVSLRDTGRTLSLKSPCYPPPFSCPMVPSISNQCSSRQTTRQRPPKSYEYPGLPRPPPPWVVHPVVVSQSPSHSFAR